MDGICPDFVLELYLRGETPQVVLVPNGASAQTRGVSKCPLRIRGPFSPAGQGNPVDESVEKSETEESDDSRNPEVSNKKAFQATNEFPSALILRESCVTPHVQQYSIPVGEQITIGRKETCDVVIAHPKVSRYHAAISVLPRGDTVLSVIGSKSVTLNGSRCAPVMHNKLISLNRGDKIVIGSETFILAEVPNGALENVDRVRRDLTNSTPKAIRTYFHKSPVVKNVPTPNECMRPSKKQVFYDTTTPPPPYNSPVPVGLNDVSHLHCPTPIKYQSLRAIDPEKDLDEPFAPLRETQSVFHGNSSKMSIPPTGKLQHHFPSRTKINQHQMHRDQAQWRLMEIKKPIFRLDNVTSAWKNFNANDMNERHLEEYSQKREGARSEILLGLPIQKQTKKIEYGERRNQKMYVPDDFPKIDVLENEDPFPRSQFQNLKPSDVPTPQKKLERKKEFRKRNKEALAPIRRCAMFSAREPRCCLTCGSSSESFTISI
ncbi:uncharacterized protein LOC131879540 isoform X2 [Tigriopus californicus]|uniref:uncharacterized protein LOC131879540 isoform X2 n=1 Tax=Tigriopus californicus TaxID=6832 RepID=UPI0027DA6FD5|nr:uncharacterized protein LOC131879540 isoform X2 [Tigriopus californicus]